jgi:hypothetical protein
MRTQKGGYILEMVVDSVLTAARSGTTGGGELRREIRQLLVALLASIFPGHDPRI